jgi:ABC-type transporter Mla subunit MlaD
MPDRVPYNERHAHLFEKNLGKSTTQAEPFARQLASEIPFGRYDKVFYGINNEELYAQRQSALDQLANGTAKMAGTFTTSFLEGTVGVINGLAEYASTGNFSSFYDNSFNRSLDEMNKSMEDALPNYYTQAEKDAEWWSSTNILSANFFGDKILKNLGYSFGALAGGYGWGAALKGIGLTSRLVRAGQGLKALQAVETAMVNAPKAQKFGAINQALNSVWNSTKGAVGTALTNSERAIISSTGMLGEATIEALQSSNEFRNKLIDDYKNLYGVNPTGEDLEEINSYADNVGNTVLGANAALLSVSNFIQLPKILGSSKTAEKRMINNITREGAEVGSKFVAGTPSTGNILSPVVGALGKPGRLLDKYVLGPGRLAFSTGEAIEEGMQYATQVGTQDYFERAYANKEEVESTLDGIVGSMRSIATEGVRRALTDKEGLESILIGGVSGALQKGITNIRERGLTGTGGVYGKNTQLAINALNKTNINDVLRDGVRYTGIAIGSQKLRQEAIKNDDVLNEKDYEKDFQLSYVLPRVKYGKVDSIIQEIDYYRQQVMSPTGFQELRDSGVVLEGETKEKFTERLNSLEETAKNTDRIYSSIEDKYSGVVVDNKPLYSSNVIDKLAYAVAKVADYDGRIPSVNNKLITAGVDNITEILKDVIDGKMESLTKAADDINNRTDITTTQKTDTIQLLEDVADMTLRRDKFLKEYDNILKNPKQYDDSVTPEKIQADKEEEEAAAAEGEETPEGAKVIKIKGKTGEHTLLLGEEYFIGKGFDYDKDGLEVPITVSALTILGENEDGTIKIKDNKGEVRDISKDVLLDYKITRSSIVNNNKTANYFRKHKNEIFEYNFGKDGGGKKPGRIEYSNGKLFFVYNDKGKIKRKALKNEHFEAQEGFKEARIKKIGSVETAEQAVAREEFTSREEIARQKAEDTLARNRGNRLEIIVELEEETRSRLEEVNRKLDAKKKDLESIQEDLNKIGEVTVAEPRTKREKALEAKYPELSRQNVKLSKVLSTTSKAITKLSRMKEDTEDEIAKLTAEKNELELNLSYFEDFAQNLDELPENSGEFLKELQNQVKWIDLLIKETSDNISTLLKLAKDIESAIKEFLSMLQSSLQKFDADYPSYIKDSMERMKDNPVFSEVKVLKEYLADYALLQDVQKDISINEKQLEDANKEIADLYDRLNELANEYNAKKQILDRFQSVADAYQLRKAEEERLFKNQQLLSEALGTADNDVQTEPFSKEYEPTAKKSTVILPRATAGVMRGKPHQIRANTFGFNLERFPNRENIRGVYVTSKNEDEIISGLTDRLRMDEAGQINEDIKKDEIIALVMVEEDGDGNISLVGEDGQPIAEGANPLDTAIYQVFPDAELRWGAEYDNASMFRKDTPKEVVDSVTAQYKAWRTSVLENPSLRDRHTIGASFGRVQNVTDTDGKIIYETRTSVEDANLISAADLESSQLINIPTLPSEGSNFAVLEQGTTTLRTPIGSVVLELPNGLVKLQNRKHTQKEAETIYQVIHQLAKNMLNPQVGIKSPESERLLNWLKSVVYWGIPVDQNKERKPAGYNSIFFEKDPETGKFMLSMSGRGKDFPFTPTSLEENKNEIILLLSNMYNNIKSHYTKQLNESYEEILSISPKGEVISRTWKNYQSYLLSNTTPDGKKRSGEELPLATTMRPTANEEDINRTDIYFYTTDTADDFVIPVVEKKKVATIKRITPGAPATPTAPAPKAEAPSTAPSTPAATSTEAAKADINSLIDKRIVENELTNGRYSFYPTVNAADKDEGVVITKNNVNQAIEAEEELGDVIYDNKSNTIVGIPSPIIYIQINPGISIEFLNAKDLQDFINDPKQNTQERAIAKEEYDRLSALEGSKPAAATEEPPFETVTVGVPEAVAVPTIGYVLDGESKNIYVSPEGKQIIFVAPSDTTPANLIDKIKILKGGDLDEVVAKIKAAGKDPGEMLKKTVFNAIAPTLDQIRATEEELVITIPEVTVADASAKVGKPISKSILDTINKRINGMSDEALRVIIDEKLKSFVPENWNQVETWLKANFPNVPVYRVKNIIQATNGKQAWGMFKDGAIYIYENAEVGTVYHEVFHAVWRMFSDATEQKAVMDEMRARSGKFFDRTSLKDVSYSEATEEQLEERLAEEFRDYIQFKKIPQKPAKGRPYILKLFADMLTTIKEFFLGRDSDSKVEKMFSKIGKGYYKSNLPLVNSLAYAKQGIIDIEDAFADSDAVLSLAGINDRERNDIIQHMTYLTLTDMIKTDESLFEVENVNKTELYNKLKTQILQTIGVRIQAFQAAVKDNTYTQEQVDPYISNDLQLMQNIEDQWNTIVERHQEYLKSYQIEFDEDENLMVRDEHNSGKSDYQDASKIDNFKKASSAIKLLLSTIPQVDSEGKLVRSSINGALLLPVGKTYISLMNNLHNSASIEEMLENLRKMAENDVNYRTLYKRITKRSWEDKGVDLGQIKTQHALQLISSLWNTFKKQNPSVKNVFILENGEVVVGEANLASAGEQIRNEYINSIVFKAKEGKGFFTYNEKEKAFVGDPAKLAKVTNLATPAGLTSFLKELGIPFSVEDVNKMTSDQYKKFKEATLGIKASIAKTEKIATFSGKALGMRGRLLELALVRAAISNPEFSSTYFSVSGERTQSYIGTNAASDLRTFLSKVKVFNKESVGGTQYSYLLTDSFAKNSNVLSRMFASNGKMKEGSEDLFEIGYVGGTVDEAKGKRKESSRLTYRQRLVQELNLNIKGWYLNLVPGDASLEWMIKLGNAISPSSVRKGMGDINEIFKGYFLSELELVREDRPVAKGRKSGEMRFFKGILANPNGKTEEEKNKLHNDIIASKKTPEQVYKDFEKEINRKIEEFMTTDMNKLKLVLSRYGILKETEEGFNIENTELPKNMTEKELNVELMALTANYMIANIEMHKLLYSDPYQYEDELKRIKNFNSPRQAIINSSPKMNTAFNTTWNKGFNSGDIGFTKFTRDYFRTATHADVIGIIDLPNYEKFKETDGAGIINMRANRHFRIRASDWNSDEERQYRYDVAWEKNDKGLDMSPEERALLAAGNPGIQSAYTPIKPIVSGSKLAKNGTASSYNNVMLDKFALYSLSYRIMKQINSDANAIKLYEKMQKEDIDYIVFASSRKVGAQDPHETYIDGQFNNAPYSEKNITNVPFSIMSIQAEVPSKDTSDVTRGSQITKLITLDFMEAGVPVDFFPDEPFNNRYKAWYKLSDDEKLERSKLYRNIKENQDLLEALIEEGYKTTLERLGIKETVTKDGRKYEITDFSKAAQTLRDEMLKREINDNASDALAGFLQGKVVLEATPAYQQIRNIIYSIADKQFISPKINGGMKVQIPSTLLESGVRKLKDGFYESEVLKFYEKDGKRVAEVMLGRWFDSPLSDEELLDLWYKKDSNGNRTSELTSEGQKILSGIGYRIPTQKQNSVDVIVIKKFLPKEFKDSVVIPAALVQKVGSDFDIDKLSIYLKNVYIKNGKPKLIPYFGIGQQAIDKFKELFDKGEFLSPEQMRELDRYIAEETLLMEDEMDDATGKFLKSIFGNFFSEEELTAEFMKDVRSKDQIVKKLYKKSLENGYIQSMENLITSDENYNNLIKPNSAKVLNDLSKKIAQKTVGQSFDYTNVDNMLDRTFMSSLRHAFVTGKYAIGIAAVNQTNHSLNQRQPIYIDKSRLARASEEDRFWLTDNPDIKFEKYNTIEVDGKMVPTLSMIKNKAGEYISDIIGMFIDGYVDISKGPWIMELGATPNVASTWLFLVKLGVPINTVAYFMNQPIIRDYLRTIESAGYSWLFIDDFVELIGYKYEQDMSQSELDRRLQSFKIPSETTLEKNLGKLPSDMSAQEKTDQYLMLKEFLKYAKMAEHMFHVTQGSNYDTASFNDPYLVFKKQMQQIKAQNTIISSVDTLLSNSFVGKLAQNINQVRDAFAQILKSDSPKVRGVIQKVLMPYVNMGDRDFVKVAQKAVADLFDWAVQTDQNLNKQITDILINDGGVGREVVNFVNQLKESNDPLANNEIIRIIEGIPSMRAAKDGVNNIKLNMAENKVYDQNNVIYAFRELRGRLKDDKNPLYDRIVTLAILQSGLSSSPISFTSLIPYEDFEKIYNATLSKLEGLSNLDDFYKLGVFERNNWNNDDITPYLKAALITSKKTGKKYYNPSMKFLPNPVQDAVTKGEIPPVLTRSKNNREANFDYIVYTWEKENDLLTKEEIEQANAKGIKLYQVIKEKKARMRKAGDFSFINKGLFRKVYDNSGTPLEHPDQEGKKYFVYKAVNAWGDSFRANEFYDVDHKSVIENGFIQVEDVDNNVIISKFLQDPKSYKRSVPTQQAPTAPRVPLTFEKAFSPERQKQILKNYTAKHKVTEDEALAEIMGSIALEGQMAIKKLKECY